MAYISVSILSVKQLGLTHIGDALDWAFMILPNYSMGMSISFLHTNYFILGVCTEDLVSICDRLPNPCCKGKKFLFHFIF